MSDGDRKAARRLRFFVAGIMHETNVSSPIPTNLDSFDWQRIDPLEDDAPPGVDSLAYGFALASARRRGHETAAGLFCMAQPSGPVAHCDWLRLKARILKDLGEAGKVDAVVLFLHGSQKSTEIEDCEADLISAILDVVGEAVPVGAILDLHTNLTREKLETGAIFVACKEYPHVDFEDRADELVGILEATAFGQVKPVSAAAKVPLVGVIPTGREPVSTFMAGVVDAEAPPILSISTLHGFSGGRGPEVGASVIVVADAQFEAAQTVALQVGKEFLDTVGLLERSSCSVEEAIERLASSTNGPLVVADRADNPGGGAAGDSTYLLEAIIEARLDRMAIGMIWDPVAVELAHAAGEGTHLSLRVGGKVGPLSGQPLDLLAEVVSVRLDAKQALFGVGQPNQPLGPSALLRLQNDVFVVINSVRQQVFSPHCFTEHGLDMHQLRGAVVKSTQHFVRGFRDLASAIVMCDAPGTMSEDLAELPLEGLQRPIFPIDPIEALEVSPFIFDRKD